MPEQTTNKQIKIIQQNLRKSITASNELKEVISNRPPDILLLQEPYCNNNKAVFNLTNNCHHADSAPNNPGTATIVLNSRLNAKSITEYSNQFCTTISITTNNKSIIISNFYIPPNSLQTEHQEFILKLVTHFSRNPVIICGDFNARSEAWYDHTTNRNGRKLSETLHETNLTIHNNKNYTCFPSSGGRSLIDLTLTNQQANDCIRNWKTCRLSTITDHKAISFSINHLLDTNSYRISNSTWKFHEKNANWNSFSTILEQNNVKIMEINKSIENCFTHNDIDTTIKLITNIMQETAYSSLNVKKTTSHSYFHSYWNQTLENHKKHFQYIRNQYNNKRISAQTYKEVRNKYVRLIRKTKRKQWHIFLEENNSNNAYGNTYKILKKRLLTTPKDIPFINGLDQQTIQNQINTLLDTVFPQSNSINHISSNPIDSLESNFEPTNINEIEFLISKTNNKKAPGPDFISNSMLKASSALFPIFANLFNVCLSKGYFPSSWTTGTAIIIPKPGKSDYLSVKSYRPIVLSSNLSKILEKIIKFRLEKFLFSNNHMTPQQHGFTSKKSTISALKELTDKILFHKNLKNKIAVVAIDIAGAFDNAPWHIIINNLKSINTPLYLINSISSYLNTRKITFQHNNTITLKNLSKGTPQGGILSPLLWNIILNDLLKIIIPNTHFIAYADDVSIVCWADKPTELTTTIKNALTIINQWCNNNYLALSHHKTSLVYFNCGVYLPIYFADETILPQKTITILGVTFGDSRFAKKLNFHEHVKNISTKCNKIKFILFGLISNCFGITTNKRLILYKSLIRTKIMYASSIWWEHLNKTDIQTLERVQYLFLRRAIQGFKTISKSSVNFLSNTLSLDDYSKFLILPHTLKINFHNTCLNLYLNNSNPMLNSYFSSFPPKHFTPNFETTQFLSGHGRFNAYFLRFKIKNSGACPCGTGVQDPHHIILRCPIFIETRKKLPVGIQLQELIATKENLTKFKNFCREALKILQILNN